MHYKRVQPGYCIKSLVIWRNVTSPALDFIVISGSFLFFNTKHECSLRQRTDWRDRRLDTAAVQDGLNLKEFSGMLHRVALEERCHCQ